MQDNNYKNVSAVILSGGLSSRMGEDKCDLEFHGKTLLNMQIEKMQSIGITDIIAAGYRGENCKGKIVADHIMKGPLSGIYLAFKEMKNDRAVVISVDVPLVKKETIKKLIDYSFEKDLDVVTIAHSNKREPLIGVYKRKLIDDIKEILDGDRYSVMRLIDRCKEETLDVDDDEICFINVNNKDDYKRLLEMNLIGG